MMFVAFEGIDGSGKSTITRLVAETLKKDGYKVYTTHEPMAGACGFARAWPF